MSDPSPLKVAVGCVAVVVAMAAAWLLFGVLVALVVVGYRWVAP